MKKLLVILLSIILLAACSEDTEPNPNPEPIDPDAITLNFGEVARGSIDSEDKVNLYSLEIEEPGVAELALSAVPEGLTVLLTFYQPDGKTPIGTKQANSNTQAAQFFSLLAPETYFIEIKRVIGTVSEEEYLLSASLDTTDKNELNGNLDTATVLDTNTETSGTIYGEGDVDFYKVETDETGVLEVLVPSAPSGLTIGVDLLDERGVEVDTSQQASSVRPAEFKHLSLAGTFFIKVSRLAGPSSKEIYNLNVSLETGDENELNDGFPTATPLELGKVTRGAVYGDEDSDYFSATVPAGSYKLLLASVPQDVSYSVTVFGEDRAPLAGATKRVVRTGGSFEFELTSETETTYYALVEASGAAKTTEMYELSVTSTP